MKKIRKPCLPPGWYPRDPAAIVEFLKPFDNLAPQPAPEDSSAVAPEPAAIAAAAPHAGWYYSGVIAAKAVSSLVGSADPSGAKKGKAPQTIALIGGHLPAGAPALFAMEDAAETPLGDMEIDVELRGLLVRDFGGLEDRWADNTVEVLLPMVKYFFPESKLLWLRFPNEIASFEKGKVLAEAAGKLGKDLKVLASTDLTHYGANYGFSPKGAGEKALDWVQNVNDRRFIEAVLSGDPEIALERAEKEKSACSAGAVLGALGFASQKQGGRSGGSEARLLAYGTSADSAGSGPSGKLESFVGYAALAWFARQA